MAESKDKKEQAHPTPRGSENVPNLSSQIELMIRQRSFILERLQQQQQKLSPSIPTASPAKPNQENCSENFGTQDREPHDPLPENEAVHPSAPLKPAITLAELQNSLNQNAVLKARISRFESVQGDYDLLKVTMHEKMTKLNHELDKIKKDLQEKENAVDRLKLRLADAILEKNSLESALNTARGEIGTLCIKSDKAQAEVGRLKPRLEAVLKSEQKLREEVKSLGDSSRLALESAAEERCRREVTEKEIERKSVELKEAREKLKHDSELSINAENYRHQLEATAGRERELIESFNRLQNDRNHIQERLSRLLVGIGQYISGPPVTVPDSAEASEPREFRPFLPFCFPDSMPRALRITRKAGQIKLTRQRPAGEGSAVPNEFPTRHRCALSHPHQLRFGPQHQLSMAKPLHFEISLEYEFFHRSQPGTIEIMRRGIFPDGFPDRVLFDSFPSRLAVNSFVLHSMSLQVPFRLLMATVQFTPLPWSLDLFMGFLYGTISRQRDLFARYIDFRALKSTPSDLMERNLPLSSSCENILRKRVAFKSLFLIESLRLSLPREKLVPDFQCNRLQTIFKSFGESLTSMYSRFEQMIQKPSLQKEDPSTPKRIGPQEDL